MESVVRTKRPALLLTSITLLFSYVFAIVGIITDFYNPRDIFIVYIFETIIIFAFIVLKASISYWHSIISSLRSKQALIKGEIFRAFLIFVFILIFFSIFVAVFIVAEWSVIEAIFESEISATLELVHLKGIIFLLLGHHIFSFFINFIRNKEYLHYFDDDKNTLIFRIAINRIFIVHIMFFLYIPLSFFVSGTSLLLIPFIILRYIYDLKVHISSHTHKVEESSELYQEQVIGTKV